MLVADRSFKELMLNAVALNAILDVDELLGSLTESLKGIFWKKGSSPLTTVYTVYSVYMI